MSKKLNKITLISTIILIFTITLASYLYTSKLSIDQETKVIKSKVVTSFYPLEFLAKEIGKDLIEVKNITPAGSEPHEYEPTQQQIIDINESNILLTNGAGLESWTTKLAQNPDKNNSYSQKIVELSKFFKLSELEEEGKTVQDPHIWLSPKNYIKMASIVKVSLQKNQNQTNQSIIQNNAQELIQKLQILERQYSSKLDKNNCKNNKFVTNHAAFGYLAKDYNLEPLSINGLSPESEPSTKELADLSQIIKTNNIKYVLTETITSPKLAQTLAKEVNTKTLEMNPLEGLTQEEITRGKNYITIMEENLESLAQALECK